MTSNKLFKAMIHAILQAYTYQNLGELLYQLFYNFYQFELIQRF